MIVNTTVGPPVVAVKVINTVLSLPGDYGEVGFNTKPELGTCARK